MQALSSGLEQTYLECHGRDMAGPQRLRIDGEMGVSVCDEFMEQSHVQSCVIELFRMQLGHALHLWYTGLRDNKP